MMKSENLKQKVSPSSSLDCEEINIELIVPLYSMG